MTSLLTNTSAMNALQTLRTVGSDLSKTQSQVSSGLRVETASDNAAYWSIATTMRSDRMAVSAVSDALGLGAAKVDTASAGVTTTIEVLSDFKAKLVAATEDGVDRSKIQDELEQMKAQFVSTATSASFNGVNWLNTDDPRNLVELSSLPANLTSSFIRSADGTVSVGQTQVDLADVSLFNVGGGGALQKDIRSLGDIGGLRNALLSSASNYGRQGWAVTGPITLTGSDTISFDLSIDGGPNNSITVSKSTVDAALGTSDGAIPDYRRYALVLNQALADAGLASSAWVEWAVDSSIPAIPMVSFVTTEQSGSNASSISVSNVQQLPAGNAGGLTAAPHMEQIGTYAKSQFNFTAPFRVYRDVSFSFDVGVDGDPAKRVVVDRNLVDSVLGTNDGMINSAADFVSILSAAAAGTGIDITATGGVISFEVDSAAYPQMGRRSSMNFGDVTDNLGPVADFDILDVDITDASADIANYLSGVDAMLKRVVVGGSVLGSAQKRLDMQTDFTSSLGDSIDKGVGRLVDTDMEEASARLAAQQTQQQLAVQSLQIANSSAQGILSLFR
ncbi:flagellin [Rhizobium sp. Rhizsp42]|uniref:flagellin N-terminal helical domain-containing protein n=1 Tax=Rhizobium sp. Rhizsp42 TaxID=3243034 RepID=UPI0039AF367F